MNDQVLDGVKKTGGSTAPILSEAALAHIFATRHASKLRYVAEWAQWMRYDGVKWKKEKTLLAFDLARKECCEAASRSKSKKLASAATVSAVEKLAKADRRIAMTADAWDANIWLLNTPAGVVDLRTGEMRRHLPEDYITKVTPVSPGGDCPLWRQHLALVTAGDEEMQAYLQRAAGYSLTGSTREEVLFFCYGEGSNGKTKTFETFLHILGDYQTTTPSEVFMVKAHEGHLTEVANLAGARFVSSSEIAEGQRWNEARLKQMTGGDTVSARYMRQDLFQFKPQAKFWFVGNHKPSLRSVDEAITRRFHLIPFNVTIPTERRDLRLLEKLKAEAGGILAWMIEGCMAWQRLGLRPPEQVKIATKDYLSGQDFLITWFHERVMRDPTGGIHTKRLYLSYKTCAHEAGERYVLTESEFSQRLGEKSETLGITKSMHVVVDGRRARGFAGITWRPEANVNDVPEEDPPGARPPHSLHRDPM